MVVYGNHPAAPPLLLCFPILTGVCVCVFFSMLLTGGQGVWPVYCGTYSDTSYQPRGHNLYCDLIIPSSICHPLPTFTRAVVGEACSLEEVKQSNDMNFDQLSQIKSLLLPLINQNAHACSQLPLSFSFFLWLVGKTHTLVQIVNVAPGTKIHVLHLASEAAIPCPQQLAVMCHATGNGESG